MVSGECLVDDQLPGMQEHDFGILNNLIFQSYDKTWLIFSHNLQT